MPKALPQVSESSHQDANQVYSIIGVQGTLGTADIAGTAPTVAIGADPLTGAMYVNNIGASNLTVGTIERVNKIGTLEFGTVSTTLALNTGTISTIVAGTQNTLGTVGTVIGVGTISNIVTTSGTVTGVGTVSGVVTTSGTVTGVGVVTSVTNLASGTLLNSGTTTGVGVVSSVSELVKGTVTNLVSGTVTALAVGTIGGKAASGAAAVANPVQIAGTDAGGTIYSPLVTTGGIMKVSDAGGTVLAGTLTNLVSGTINALAAGTITTGTVAVTTGTVVLNTGTITTFAAGTQNTLGTVGVVNNIVTGTLANSGTTTGVGVVSNLTNGSVNILTGTVTSVTNLANGTIHRDHIPVQTGTSFVTNGTTGAAVWGTIIAASGAGTKQYVSGLAVVVTSGTVDVAITNVGVGGSTGAGVLTRGNFPAGGGIVREFDPVMVSGTNGTIAYWLGGAGTVNLTVNYWQGV